MRRIVVSSAANENRLAGARFEAVFVHRAGVSGYLAIKQHLQHRYLPGGRAQAIKSELDFSLIEKTGRVSYIDCKSFGTHRVAKSQLDKAQISRAALYNQWSVPAGFVVELRPLGKVVFFSGLQFWRLPKGKSLGLEDGKLLGPSATFRFDAIWAAS
jgi:hypothetical protein